ncbi:acetyltransferase [Pedobacter foliorum]|uniref:acetyltransferase n=1 Tax=Pedobacter foliorum TaxID=2739058 RepID=UPI001567066A|nr:acetyltransferase [Pedobacter foliorum]NRF39142.1 acetyltransferase [Pedobacter foliorum]
MFDRIGIIGYSGHGFVVADAAHMVGLSLEFYCERFETERNPFKLKYLGFDGDKDFIGWKEDYKFILGVGDNQIRNAIALRVLANKKELLNVVHPDALISSYVEMGIGNFISKRAAVNPLASIGDFCILNTGCIVEHECKIGNAVHIAPGAVLAGNVEVGDFTFIGANSVIKQGVKIGSNVIIGAGSVILKDIADHKKIVGNPGRMI